MGSDEGLTHSGVRHAGRGRKKTGRCLLVGAAVSLFLGTVLLAAATAWYASYGSPPPPVLPPAGKTINASSPFLFAMLADSRGNGSICEEIIKEIQAEKVSLILHGGDLVLRESRRHFDWVLHELDEERLDVPFCAVAGNHDLGGRSKGQEAAYASYTRAFGPRHYWFRCANALFVALDTAPGSFSKDEQKWLDDTLTLHRPDCAACFVFTHYPPRDPRPKGFHGMHKGGEALVALLKKHRVSALLASHIHGYLEDNVEGIPVFITGGGGAKLEEGFDKYHYLLCTVEADGSFRCWRNDMGETSNADMLEYQFYVSFRPLPAAAVGAVLLALGVALLVRRRKKARLATGERKPA